MQYDYDPLRRLRKENVTSGANIGEITYDNTAGYPATGDTGYDRVGNRRKRAVGLNPAVNGFETRTYADYDANDRLGSAAAGKVSASFDANGNTLRVDLDANGTWDQGTRDVYDIENRLITATRPSLVWSEKSTIGLVYDGDGNRVQKKVETFGTTTTTTYLVDDRNPTGYPQVIEERVEPDSTGLVGYWRFDEGSGTTAQDSSGNSNTGSLIGSPEWLAEGVCAGFLRFNGANYVEVANSPELEVGKEGADCAVSFWLCFEPLIRACGAA